MIKNKRVAIGVGLAVISFWFLSGCTDPNQHPNNDVQQTQETQKTQEQKHFDEHYLDDMSVPMDTDGRAISIENKLDKKYYCNWETQHQEAGMRLDICDESSLIVVSASTNELLTTWMNNTNFDTGYMVEKENGAVITVTKTKAYEVQSLIAHSRLVNLN